MKLVLGHDQNLIKICVEDNTRWRECGTFSIFSKGCSCVLSVLLENHTSRENSRICILFMCGDNFIVSVRGNFVWQQALCMSLSFQKKKVRNPSKFLLNEFISDKELITLYIFHVFKEQEEEKSVIRASGSHNRGRKLKAFLPSSFFVSSLSFYC